MLKQGRQSPEVKKVISTQQLKIRSLANVVKFTLRLMILFVSLLCNVILSLVHYH